MNWLIFARIALTATFLIIATCGPLAIILLRRFIIRYTVAHKILENDHASLKAEHEALKTRVETLERWIQAHEALHD